MQGLFYTISQNVWNLWNLIDYYTGHDAACLPLDLKHNDTGKFSVIIYFHMESESDIHNRDHLTPWVDSTL